MILAWASPFNIFQGISLPETLNFMILFYSRPNGLAI